jgi:uncharacterized protein DUF5309
MAFSGYTAFDLQTASNTAKEILLKEQVDDLLINLFPLDTPLQQILGREQMGSTFQAQPIDTFGTAAAERIRRTASVFSATAGANFDFVLAKPEGHTYSLVANQYPGKWKSVAEIQGEAFAVSDTDRALSMWAMQDRFAMEALKSTQSTVNNFEHAFWWGPGSEEGGKQMHTGGGDDIARQTQGLIHCLLKSGLTRSKHGTSGAANKDLAGNIFGTNNPALNRGAMTWAFDAAGLPLDQSMFKDSLMGQWYSITGRQAGAVGFCGARTKNLFSQFALTANGAINDRTLDAASKLVVDTVDFYETDFGVISLNLCRYLNIAGQSIVVATDANGDGTDDTNTTVPFDEVLVFIHPAYFKIGVVRPVSFASLGKTGDFEQGLVRGEQGFICKCPQAGVALVNHIP